MPYWQLYYHIVWATKNREPLLTPEIEPVVFGIIRNKALDFDATVYALNGYYDHVHLVAAVPPKVALAKFVGQVKAVASVRVNQSRLTPTPFYWQEEYGIFSFDRKRLSNIVTYVELQKEHHSDATIIPVLEQFETLHNHVVGDGQSDSYLLPSDKSPDHENPPDKSG